VCSSDLLPLAVELQDRELRIHPIAQLLSVGIALRTHLA
jgi:hypothetical protein